MNDLYNVYPSLVTHYSSLITHHQSLITDYSERAKVKSQGLSPKLRILHGNGEFRREAECD